VKLTTAATSNYLDEVSGLQPRAAHSLVLLCAPASWLLRQLRS
jgi:hypothetical protein